MADKDLVARTLDTIAQYLELDGANTFKYRAFSKAADAVRNLEGDLDALIEQGLIEDTPGIGSTTARVIREVVVTGESHYLDELRARYPPGILDLLEIPGLGLKKVQILHAELSIGSIDDLERAIRNDAIAALPGFGKKVQQRVAEGLSRRRQTKKKMLVAKAVEVASRLSKLVEALPSVERVEVTGAVRRRLEIVETISLLVATEDADDVVRSVLSMALPECFEESGSRTLLGRSPEGIPVELFLIDPKRFASTLLLSTGSDEFVSAFMERATSQGASIGFEGVSLDGRVEFVPDEVGLFELVGLKPVIPELRESGEALDRGAVDSLDVSDLRGTFHIHSTWSDGRSTLKSMLETAASLGLEYVGISDHSKSATYAKGLSEERVDQQLSELRSLSSRFDAMRIFAGTECDILGDGSLDFDSQTLAKFDFVVASIHSGFSMSKQAMTDRIRRAIENPFVTFLGHLTGRKLLLRDGYEVDHEQIFAAAAEHGVIIEINGHPRRLDLDWRWMSRAVEMGVTLSVHPDAHEVGEFSHLLTGSWAARKGGVAKSAIFNTKPASEVAAWLEGRRAIAMERL